MAGTDSRFSAAKFRDAITFAMSMGAPVRPEDRATFHFKTKVVYPVGTRLDQEGRPLNSSVEPSYETPDPITLENVAIEFQEARPEELPVGVRIPTRVVITMLQAEYDQIRDQAATGGEEFALEVEIGEDYYRIGYRPAPLALFDAGIYQLVCYAVSEA